jgi:tetratricopeptide (TPR) repeat protein
MADEPVCEQLRRSSEELSYLGHLREAREKAVAALRAATDTYGAGASRLAPFYLAVADVALRDKQFAQAEEVLALINWLLIKDRGSGSKSASLLATATTPLDEDATLPEETRNLLVVRMNKLSSLLHLELGRFDEALRRAAHGAYHCALLFGPEHLYTSELYFSLGLIFDRSHRHQRSTASATSLATPSATSDSALAMLDKVVDIWYRFLTSPPEETAAWMLSHQKLRLYEAVTMLAQVAALRKSALGDAHVATGEAMYTQSLLLLFLGDHARAKTTVKQALDIYVATLVRCNGSGRM